MLARCAGKDKYMPVVETLFAKQPDWVVQEADPAAAHDRQAVRLHRGVVRPMPGESEGARQHPERARPRRREARGQFDADLLHQRQEADRATCRSTQLAKENRPLSQGRIRVFRPGAGPRRGLEAASSGREPARESLDNPASLLRFGPDNSFSAPMRHPATRRIGVSLQRFPSPPPQGGRNAIHA